MGFFTVAQQDIMSAILRPAVSRILVVFDFLHSIRTGRRQEVFWFMLVLMR